MTLKESHPIRNEITSQDAKKGIYGVSIGLAAGVNKKYVLLIQSYPVFFLFIFLFLFSLNVSLFLCV